MFNQLLFFIALTTFGTGMFIFYIFYFFIFAIIVGSVIKAIKRGIKAAKNIQDNDNIFVEHNDNQIKTHADYIACEYCGFVNKYDNSKCSCCGAPIKNKNAR